MALDLQLRAAPHGHLQHNKPNETEDSCVNSTAEPL
jgi:hypothetical protein